LLRGDPYNERMDPEGVLSTLPSLVNVLFGAFAGRFLAAATVRSATSMKLLATGIGALLLAFLLSPVTPISKPLWTSSFVLLTSGLAAIGLALCYEWVDVRDHNVIARPLEVLGMNAIAAYLLSSAIDALVARVQVGNARDAHSIYDAWLRLCHLPRADAAFLFALLQALLVWAVAQALHARAWYLKV
jgi:predicted acyltransferase